MIIQLLIALCYVSLSSAQSVQQFMDKFDEVDRRLVEYRNNTYEEKVFAHTDKNTYAVGEYCRFKIYCTDAVSHEPSLLSKVVYLEVLASGGERIVQEIIQLENGSGHGTIYLPGNVKSGNYRLRAYTNWMKNAGPEFYFQKELLIINPQKRPEPKSLDLNQESNTYELNFFPEGGNLVEGLTSVVAFKGTDEYGKGIDFQGVVKDEKDSMVVTFSPYRHGIGRFSFTPEAGKKYYALLTDAFGRKHRYDLPKPYPDGYAMHVRTEEKGFFTINVSTSEECESFYKVLIHSRGVLAYSTLLRGNENLRLDQSKFQEGIIHITLFDENQTPVCERLFFVPLRSQQRIQLLSSNNEYGNREKIKLEVTTRDQVDMGLQTDVSLTVNKFSEIKESNNSSILSYIFLSADLKGEIENPDFYMKGKGPEVYLALDNLMLTHGWRRFDWNKIISRQEPKPEYEPELAGHLLNFQMLHNGETAPPSTIVYLTIPDRFARTFESRIGKGGTGMFEVGHFKGVSDIILQTPFDTARYNPSILSPYDTRILNSRYRTHQFESRYENEIMNAAITSQVQYFYEQFTPKRNLIPPSESVHFYGEPLELYYLDDYTRFKKLEEVITEYVQGLRWRQDKNGHLTFRLVNPETEEVYKDPLILIDGLPIVNKDLLIDYDPLKIETISLIKREFYFGNKQYEGVVSFSTYDGDLDGFDIPKELFVGEYNFFNAPREFYQPQYESSSKKENKHPDFRSTLYWNPTLKLNDGRATIEFYASDLDGQYNIELKGISGDGRLIEEEISIVIN